jgi:glycosyltransferase involved in cell wall biosynthesis
MREPPRVIFVNHTLDPTAGGAEKVLYALLRGLVAGGLDVHLAAPREQDREPPMLDVECHWLPPFQTASSRSVGNLARAGIALARISLTVTSLLRQLRPDLIYVNSIFALHFCAIPAMLCRVPFVYHEHNLVGQRAGSIWNLAFTRLAGRAAIIVAISEAVAEELRRAGIPSERIRVVHNAIECAVDDHTGGSAAGRAIDRSDTGRCPSRSGTFRIAQVANLHRWKGHGTVIRAIAIARSEGLDVSVSFFGRAQDEAFESDLHTLARDLGVSGWVEFLGFVPSPTSRLGEFDSLVLASDAEPFGLAILEGMSAGIPVVATASGGALEIIEEGKSGLLFEPNDPESLAACWKRLLMDPAFGKQLTENAFDTLRSQFSPESQIGGVRSAMEDALR